MYTTAALCSTLLHLTALCSRFAELYCDALYSMLSCSVLQISNQARWAVLQAYTLIRQNKKALDAVVAALKDGKKMGDVALAIESSVGA